MKILVNDEPRSLDWYEFCDLLTERRGAGGTWSFPVDEAREMLVFRAERRLVDKIAEHLAGIEYIAFTNGEELVIVVRLDRAIPAESISRAAKAFLENFKPGTLCRFNENENEAYPWPTGEVTRHAGAAVPIRENKGPLPVEDKIIRELDASDVPIILPAEPLPKGALAPYSDLANAHELILHHGMDAKYCPSMGWLCWDGRRFLRDDAPVHERAKSVVGVLLKEAQEKLNRADKGEARKAAKARVALASKAQGSGRIKAMLELARTDPLIATESEAFDSDPWSLNTANGIINLRNGELNEPLREKMMTKLSPVEYTQDAETPLWERFLEKILPDEAVREFVQRAAGYSLTGFTTERLMFFLHGEGANGKSVFLATLLKAFGGYGLQASSSILTPRRDDSPTNDIARLDGARFVVAMETNEGQYLNEKLVKHITGGVDKMTARFLFKEPFDFIPGFSVWLGTNHRPKIRGTDPAIWSRICLIPFEVVIPPENQDQELTSKLEAELPGILAWAVDGCLNWQRDGLQPPAAVMAAVEEYRSSEDFVGQFLEEKCVLSERAVTFSNELYRSYKSWHEAAGNVAKPLSKRDFGCQIKAKGFLSGQESIGRRRALWYGIGLRTGLLAYQTNQIGNRGN